VVDVVDHGVRLHEKMKQRLPISIGVAERRLDERVGFEGLEGPL
jgi:hypothetical protein